MHSVDRLDVDRPALRVNAAPEAAERESLRLKVQHHVVPAQPAEQFPKPATDETHERDGPNGLRGDVQRPSSGVNLVKHVRSKSNESANTIGATG